MKYGDNKSFLIADDNGIGRVYLVIFIIVCLSFFAQFLVVESINNQVKIIVFFLSLVLIYVLIKNFYYSRKVSIDYIAQKIHIRCRPFKLYHKQISFNSIKCIYFFEKKKMHAEIGECWQKSIKIIGMQNDILYESNVSRIINYPLLEKSCRNYFVIDYIVEDKES